MDPLVLSTVIFVVSYALIVSEKIHKTYAALCGAVATLLLHVMTQEEAFHSLRYGVDWAVIFLLLGMMIIVTLLTRTGVFQYVAIRAVKLVGGDPLRIMLVFAGVTAVGSAFLDNVTTVMLMAPVTLLVTKQLKLDPVPYLITEALASNIGGAATLIGDPPNLMIGSKAGFGFMDFLVHMAPASLLILGVWLAIWRLVFARRLTVDPERVQKVMALDESKLITDRKALKIMGTGLGLTLVGFLLHGPLGLEPATVALAGAALMLAVSGVDPEEVFSELEWPTLFFFIGLFIIIGGTVKAGLIEHLSAAMIDLTGPTPESMFTLSMVMVWFASAASAVVDNIPFVATMNPLLLHTSETVLGSTDPAVLQSAVMQPVWWALALGACLGGNGTAIGASANVIVVGMSEKAGHPISFLRFMAYGLPVMLLSVLVATGYVYVRYYVLGI